MTAKAQTGGPLERWTVRVEDRTTLLRKYREAVEKYEKLVHRYNEDFSGHSSAMMLALVALRASANGLALFDGHRFLTRNERWLELARERARWSPVGGDADPDRGAGHQLLEAVASALARELLAGEGSEHRTAVLARDGDGLTVEIRLERVVTNEQRLVIVIAEDVTERLRSEREMARAREAVLAHERMRLLGELASGVAHDLNNTLHALSLRIGHLLATPLDDSQRESVDVLARICADAAERVSRLQELARRREDVPTESFDLAAVMREALAVARPEIEERGHVAGVRFELETDFAADVRAVGSPAELRHAFVNLLLNARDAMPRGGRIRLASRIADDRAMVTVQDQGTGIPAEHLDRVFDPFFTTKGPHGMGLGLAIVQGVMRRLGGQIAAGNHPEGGAVFTLTFPIAPPVLAEAAPGPERTVAPGHRLLVVDDDVDNLEAAKCVLEDLGQDVDVACSGEEALELLDEGRRRYDLVLCDVGMPGMNGWQVATAVKRVAPGTRVVLLTGWAQEIAPEDAKRGAVDGILGKPLDLARLRRFLSERLGERVPAH